MIAAIFSKNQSTRIGIEAHLRLLHFSQIFIFSDRHELTHHLSKEKSIPDIVIFDLLDADEFSFRLFPASTSILLLVQDSNEELSSKHYILRKPFGFPGLADGIQQCMVKSAWRRNHLVVIGEHQSHFVESIARLQPTIHLKEVLFCKTDEELRQIVKQDSQKIGAILVTMAIGPELASSLWRWKRSSEGLDTTLAVWAHQENIYPLRTSVDLVWIKDKDDSVAIDAMVTSISENSLHLKKNRLLLLRTNRLFGKKSYSVAKKLLKESLKSCSNDPRILQQLGRAYLYLNDGKLARTALDQSVNLNPCLPNTYIELMSSLDSKELPTYYQALAKLFCPHHPIGLTDAR